MAGFAKLALGAALIAGSVFTGGLLAPALLSTGISLVIGGIGSLLSHGPPTPGIASRNPIAPWNVIYGRARVGGTTVYIEENGTTNKYLHQVIVLACHPCQAVDQLLFNNKRVVLDTNGNSISFGNSTAVIGHQQSQNIASITRVNDVVTVTLTAPIPPPAGQDPAFPTLLTGDMLSVQNVGVDHSLNGTFTVTVVSSTVVTYISGGNPVTVTNQGQVYTTYPDWGDTVHMEVLLGNQTSTFPTLLSGSNGLWTNQHLLSGRTCVYLRLKYGGQTYANGLPTIAFVVRGKNDILDPRTNQTGYSENAALCIADYLAQKTFGFKAVYGTEIPLPELMAAANVCDEAVPIAAGGTEPRYACNGQFALTTKRGEVLQNLLTSCAGRLTYSGGRFVVHPGAFTGVSLTLGGDFRVGEPIIVPAVAATITTDWEDQGGGGDRSFGNGTVQIAFDGQGGATMQFLGTAQGTTYSDDYGVGGQKLVGANVGPGPVAIPHLPAVGSELVVQIFTPAGTYVSGPANHNPDLFAHCRLTSRSAGYPSPPSLPNVLALASGPFQWKSKVSVRDLFNGVKGTYISPGNNWQTSDIPPYAQDATHGYGSDANLAADGGDRRWLEIQLPFTISTPAAQRLAKIELLRRRQQGTGTFAFNMSMYQCTALDVLAMTLPVLGWQNKLVEITAHRFTLNDQSDKGQSVTVLGTEIDVQETDPSIYNWSSSEELSAQGFQQAALPNNTQAAPPTGLSAVSNGTTTSVGADGVSRTRIAVGWTAPADGYVTNGGSMQVQYRLTGTTNWTSLQSVDPSVTTAYIDNVNDGQSYDVQVRSVNVAGAASAWVSAGPVAAARTVSQISYGALSGAPLITVNGS